MNKALVHWVTLIAVGFAYAEPPSADEVFSELRKGGCVLFIRCPNPKTNTDLADTDPQFVVAQVDRQGHRPVRQNRLFHLRGKIAVVMPE